MSKRDRDERRRRKEERMARDRDNVGMSGSFVLSKHGLTFDFFKLPKQSSMWCNVHVVPYIVKSPNHPEVRAGRMKIGDEDYFLEYGQHRNVGPDGRSSVLCLRLTYGLPCPICEDAQARKDAGEGGKLPWPSRRAVYNILEDGAPYSSVKVFETSHKNFHQELKSKLNRSERGFFDFSDIDEGALVRFYAEWETGQYAHHTFKDFEFRERDPLTENIFEHTIPLGMLLNVPTYEQVQSFYEGEIAAIAYDSPANPVSEEEGSVYAGHAPSDDESDEPESEDDYSEDDEPTEEQEAADREARAEAEPKLGPQRGARAAARRAESGESQRLKYGDTCPHGLTFGKDNDTVRDKCGLACDDKLFNLCADALEAHGE